MPDEVHVHGRFQPFHDEHLAYARWAAEGSDRLLVGITNADPAHTSREEADPERHRPQHNPFTYHERYRMVRGAVRESDIDVKIDVLPFPINRPDLWDYYAPRDVVHYVNVLEPWHERKVERLREHGRTVFTKRGERTMSGTDIRDRMRRGDRWTHLVPPAVASVVDELDGEQRVRTLYRE